MNKVQPLIVWNETLLTGIKNIDDQHQILVSMLNEANDRLAENNGREMLEEMIRDLMSYALYHFDTEEALMLENNYPEENKLAHFHEHRNFSSEVSMLQQNLRQGKRIPLEELLTFLNDWLVDHILKTDMELANFLVSHGIK
jgi:hemerythrin-like metal-binding protein